MVKWGTLYGIGVGPGDPEWITVKAARVLAECRHVCVPRSGEASQRVALDIARPHLRGDATVHELDFPMTSDAAVLAACWRQAAERIRDILATGDDCCFLTLGDALLYSTYTYLLRELREVAPQAKVVTVPGVTAFSAAAALSGSPVGQGKQPITIVPGSDDFEDFRQALRRGGTVVLMKVGKRLQRVLDELDAQGLTGRAVFVARAGLSGQRVVTDVATLRGEHEETGYLSIMIIQATREESQP